MATNRRQGHMPLAPAKSPPKWHFLRPSGHPEHPRKKASPRLALEPDNNAEASWRAQQPATDHVRIPDELVAIDKAHEIIAKHHGAFILSEHTRGNGGSQTFGIWGDKCVAAATKQAILTWIGESGCGKRNPNASAQFHKVASLTPAQHERWEKRHQREVTRQLYRQHPHPQMKHGAIGSFLWPVQEYRPEEILGPNYEALDAVRMDHSCHIVFLAQRNMFRVMGKQNDVLLALQRLRRTCFQVAAKQVVAVRRYLLRWPEPVTNVPKHVHLQDYQPILPVKNEKKAVMLKAPAGGQFDNDDDDIVNAQIQNYLSGKELRTSIVPMLGRLHYYRGHLQMRWRLGTFLASQYREPYHGKYDLKGEYEVMLGQSQFIGEVSQETGNKAVEEKLLSIVQQATELLTPSEAMSHDLHEVRPVYGVTFTFEDDIGNLVLEVEWQEQRDYDTQAPYLELYRKKWIRLDRDATTLTPLLDISLCDLNTRLSWQVDMKSCPQVLEEAKLPPDLQKFTKRLETDAKLATQHSNLQSFVRFPSNTKLSSTQHRRVYRYLLSGSDYTLELTHFQAHHLKPVQGKGPTLYEPRWSLTLYRGAWDVMFTKNERLPIGGEADWEHDLRTWFPPDLGVGCEAVDERNVEQGWWQLLGKLGEIDGLVMRAREVVERQEEGGDLIGGMGVG
ncbi:hypothetical protein LTR62_006074 [Meristemomyces frigidus]|uniref:DUF7905 domain-containing protein n=1 Tax=Meristemomyces frigidus TaxID=1508187 RepID=A0AAN7TKC1_9PEZI|nr:hypothetical protein LTR62_006074 [Meristemomyces frigidus]